MEASSRMRKLVVYILRLAGPFLDITVYSRLDNLWRVIINKMINGVQYMKTAPGGEPRSSRPLARPRYLPYLQAIFFKQEKKTLCYQSFVYEQATFFAFPV